MSKKIVFPFAGSCLALALLYMNCGRVGDFASVSVDRDQFASETEIGTPDAEAAAPEQLGSEESPEVLKVVADGESVDGLVDRKLQINGALFTYGLPVKTRSSLRIDVPAECSSFSAMVGVDDSSQATGPVQFEVVNGSSSVFKAELAKGQAAELVNIDLEGAATLMLHADSSSESSLANWAEARLICKDKEIIPVANLVTPEPVETQASDEEKAQVAYWSTCGTPSAPAFYVAPNGSDSNDGSVGRPFKTLSKAVSAMRGSSKKITLMRAGTYILTSPIVLDSRDNNVKIASYPCETAILDGGRRLTTGWRSEGNGIYSVAVSNPSSFRELLIDWKRAHPATAKRLVASQPLTSDWNFVEEGALKTDSVKNWFQFYSGDLTQANYPSLEGMHIQYMTWERLDDFVFPIKSIDWAKRRITMNGDVAQTAREGTFRILNNPKYVRDNYDFSWSWKASEKRVYVKVPASSSLSKIMLPTLDGLIEINNATNIMIMKLKLQGVVHDGYAITVSGGGKHKIGSNRFEWVGNAIRLGGSSDNLIGGNQIYSAGTHGIFMAPGSNRNKIYGNDFKDIGIVEKHVAGVFAYGISDNVIIYNNFQNSARYAIAIKNWDETTLNYRNVIERNWIYNNCIESADCGAVEMLGRSKVIRNDVIRNNIIDKYNGLSGMKKVWYYGFKGFGVYMDDSTSGVTISSNLIRGRGYGLANVYLHGGDKNIVEHNVGIMDDVSNDFIRLEKVAVGGDMNYDNKIQRNIVYATKVFNSTDSYVFYTSGDRNTINYNLLWNTKKYKNGVGFDQNSVIADPQFENYSAGNFKLKSTSPALKAPLSIKQTDFGKVGNSAYKHSTTYPAFWTSGL